MLSNIRIVLVNTTHPGNIGAAARAMKTMCLENLVLAAPHVFPSAEATARASGADDVLAKAIVCPSLDEALEGCKLVIGASARIRSISWPLLTPRECAEVVVKESADRPVAIIFGREHSGLTNNELDRCHYLVQIPTSNEYSSLNLASAVQVIAYEILVASRSGEVIPGVATDFSITAEEMELFYQHLLQVLIDAEFVVPDKEPKHHLRIMRRLRRLFNRARPDRREMNILRGILTAIQSRR